MPEDQFMLDPVRNMKIKDDVFLDICNNLEKFSARLESHRLYNDEQCEELYALYEKKMEVRLISLMM